MLEAGESTTRALDALHAQVEPFGRAVGSSGAVVVQDLVLPTLEVSPKERISATSSLWQPTMAFLSRVRASPTRLARRQGQDDQQAKGRGLLLGILPPRRCMRSWST